MAESFFNDPESQDSPPPGDEESRNRDIYEYSLENEGCHSHSNYEGKGGGNNNNILHSPATMVDELRKYFSNGIYDGRLLAQTIIYIFKSPGASESDIDEVFGFLKSLDVAPENSSATSAKLQFIEQLVLIAQFCSECDSRSYVIPSRLLPALAGFMRETLAEIRKNSHATLLVLLEQGLVDRRDVEDLICPVILLLSSGRGFPHEIRTEAAALLSKLAPLVGKEVSERIFLERFAELCSDIVPNVRQVCADNFGDFASVVGPEATERVLLPKFFALCKDSTWKIRKSCADEFMPVSCLSSSRMRRKKLCPLFLRLLRDNSQWVKLAAFQSLGPFISTFADPSIKAMLQNFNGEMVIADVEVLAIRLEVLEQKRALQSANNHQLSSDEEEDDFEEDELDQHPTAATSSCQSEEDNAYQCFLYWKTPLPTPEDLPQGDRDPFDDDIGHELLALTEEDDEEKSIHRSSPSPDEKSKSRSGPPPQSIVPQSLVDHFVGMIDQPASGGIEEETAHHCCAFSFPAVALTLGRSNWTLLKRAYNFLASDVQWKVRYTMAASIYELGVILGEETAGRDLLPTCKEFIRDTDEVRFGILKHLADFIRLLKPELRATLLPLLSIFLSSYNVLNWRLREELALQIDSMVDIYYPQDVKAFLAPIALSLARDKVAAVRKASLNVLCRILKCFSSPQHDALVRGLLGDLAEVLTSPKSSSWVTRQTYASLSYQILATRSLDVSHFAHYVLPHLLNLSNDRVPNVRIALARVLVDHICNIDYFNNKANPCHLSVVKTLAILESDSDMDVAQYLSSSNIISTAAVHQEDRRMDNKHQIENNFIMG